MSRYVRVVVRGINGAGAGGAQASPVVGPVVAPAPFPLDGEQIVSQYDATITSGACDTNGTSTFTVTAQGTATGPHPGTFVETVTYSWGPENSSWLGQMSSFSGVVDITSASGDVHATLSLDTSDPVANLGGCFPGDNDLATALASVVVSVPGFASGHGRQGFNASTLPLPATPPSTNFTDTFTS